MNFRAAANRVADESVSLAPPTPRGTGSRPRVAYRPPAPRIAADTPQAKSDSPRHGEARLIFRLAGDGTFSEPPIAGSATHWSELVQLAWDEGAVGALHDYCQRLPRGAVPKEIERQIACLALERQLRLRVLENRTRQSLAILNDANTDVMLLKGAALATTVYAAFTQRPMNDVDILVDPAKAEDTKRRMLLAGWARETELPGDAVYRTHHHLAPLVDTLGSRSRLEIHRTLLPEGHPFILPLSEIWREARVSELGGHRVLVLEPTRHALHIAIHFAWSHMMRAGAWHAFRDLGALARAEMIDWTELVKIARRARAATCCYWTLKLAQVLTGLAVPDSVLRELAPHVTRGLLARLERHFVQVIVRSDATHLSLRLDRALWELAIQPRRAGHRDARPWLVSAELTAARLREDPASQRERMIRQVNRVGRCSAYIMRLLWS